MARPPRGSSARSAAESESSWYLLSEGGSEGPFSLAELQERWRRGELASNARLWTEGLPNTHEAADLMGSAEGAPRLTLIPALGPPHPIARFERRVWAGALDLGLSSVCVFFAVLITTLTRAFITNTAAPSPGLALAAGALAQLLYFAVFESRLGATPGKRLMGLRVATDTGRRLRFAAACARHLGRVCSSAALGGGYVPAWRDAEGLAVHDRLTRTRVESTS
ncbi:MAG: RDD family protein [Bdellovibrionales bacterium]|nr:RDD family protein [Bdellovibrionales bacterium]